MNYPKTQRENNKPVQQSITVNVPEQIKTGVYSNLVNVTITSNQEVMFDFVYTHPTERGSNGEQLGQVVSRVILPLSVAKAMKLVMDSQMGKPKET